MSSQLQDKLLHYEVSPPEGVWNKIAASLDQNFSLTLSEKLYQYEEEPSTKIWQNISLQLDTPVFDTPVSEKSKVVPFYARYRRPLKYSGAVAIFIFVAVLTSLFISKKTESELTSQETANSNTVKKDSSKSSDTLKESNTATQSTEKSKPQHLIAKAKISSIRQEQIQSSVSSAFESFLPQQAEKNEIINSSVTSDKYMIYSDGDGNVVRLPKKIFNAFACPTEDVICKQKLQLLKEKFAASAMTTDFTGLLQILKSLQENQ